MLRKLNFTVRSFAQIGFSGLEELQVFLRYAREHLFQLNLLWGQSTIVIALLDEGRRGLNPSYF